MEMPIRMYGRVDMREHRSVARRRALTKDLSMVRRSQSADVHSQTCHVQYQGRCGEVDVDEEKEVLAL